jgi:flavin-binding protein dodecin
MNDLRGSLATVLESAPADEASASSPHIESAVTLEFVGSSDETIAEAVRRALSHASTSLQTLDGAGVVVIPQIVRQGSPRFHVTLRVSPAEPATD